MRTRPCDLDLSTATSVKRARARATHLYTPCHPYDQQVQQLWPPCSPSESRLVSRHQGPPPSQHVPSLTPMPKRAGSIHLYGKQATPTRSKRPHTTTEERREAKAVTPDVRQRCPRPHMEGPSPGRWRGGRVSPCPCTSD